MTDPTAQTNPPGTPASTRSRFEALIADIEAVPGEVTTELQAVKTTAEVATIETDVKADAVKAETAAQTAVADVKTEAAAVEAKVEGAVEQTAAPQTQAPAAPASQAAPSTETSAPALRPLMRLPLRRRRPTLRPSPPLPIRRRPRPPCRPPSSGMPARRLPLLLRSLPPARAKRTTGAVAWGGAAPVGASDRGLSDAFHVGSHARSGPRHG